ncbi:MAG: integration host factor [Eggerthellaceae bacterium]|nr:integration host factor [Eggerthellaceae bacterium]
MPAPKLTDEQRADALKKAAETRKARSEFRAKIKAGKVTAKKALAKRSDPIVGKIKVAQFIQSFPGWGKAKAEKLMAEIGIAENRRLSGLGENQIAKLIEALD